jgi:hypothetical protein
MADDDVKHAAAILGRRGGLVGGPARAKKLTPAARRRSALNAAKARWRDHKPRKRGRDVPPTAPAVNE